jgi:hypothetical protein
MKVKVALISICLYLYAGALSVNAQNSDESSSENRITRLESQMETLRRIRVSGYLQAQYQYGQFQADGINFKSGSRGANPNEIADESDFGRFGIRRGRLRFNYQDNLARVQVQLDITERGMGAQNDVVRFKDIYLELKDPWIGTNLLTVGVFKVPFGAEVDQSSRVRLSPERSRVVQSLFDDMRDVGFMLTLQAPATSPLKIVKFESGLFAGNSINRMFDSRMNLVGRLSATQTMGAITLSGGVSGYFGAVPQRNAKIFEVKNNVWTEIKDVSDFAGKYVKRQYLGADLQFAVKSGAGTTELRTEYIAGVIPGTVNATYGFGYNTFAGIPTGEIYMRNFSGGYAQLGHRLANAPFTLVAKYDRYDRNTDLSGNEIVTAADLNLSNIGFGAHWHPNPALRLTAYYDVAFNEKTDKLPDVIDSATNAITTHGWDKNRKGNVFTLRMQYIF